MVALAKMLLTLACLLLCTSNVLHNVRAESDLSTKKQSLGSGAADEGCLTGYQALLACKADYRALAERLQLHTQSFSTVQQYPWTKCLCCSALVVIGCLVALLSTCKNRTRLLQQTVAEQYQQLQDSQKQHEQEMEEARSALKKARAETRMIVRHHADKFHLPDPDYYQKRFTTLLYAARNSGFQEAEDMMAQLVHIMYKLVKLQVLYQYLYEVLQMLPTPSIHADDDIIPQKDNGPSPSRATEEAMWGKICQLDQDLDEAIQRYLDSIAEPSILNSLEPRWMTAASQKFHELVPSLDSW